METTEGYSTPGIGCGVLEVGNWDRVEEVEKSVESWEGDTTLGGKYFG